MPGRVLMWFRWLTCLTVTSTFMGYLMPKPVLKKDSHGTVLLF